MSGPMPADEVVTRSIWLPVGRANFYSYSANGWLRQKALDGSARTEASSAAAVQDVDTPPLLQVSVLRRLLEVLPRSFGYELVGETVQSNEDGDRLSRPTAVVLTLRPLAASLPDNDCPQLRANRLLVKAEVSQVQLHADEDGFYVFSAAVGADPKGTGDALEAHMYEVFGGAFSLEWQKVSAANEVPGAAGYSPAPDYNGLADLAGRNLSAPFLPRGILTFFQLNTLFEGVFNDALSPAVFLERGADPGGAAQGGAAQGGAAGPARATTALETVADVVRLLKTNLDARTKDGKVVTLRHFLAVTSRESLQRLKWSVESVRRGLLEEMMGILHRQSRLNQLRLDRAGPQELSPELATGANESQLRGYVMLAGAKLPLIANLSRFAISTANRVTSDDPPTTDPAHIMNERDLAYRLGEWNLLLEALTDNVRGLERAVEHAWMERLLYEQEQARAEQEAMAEIERSRTNRPTTTGGGVGGGSYNALMLFATVVAAVVGFATIPYVNTSQSLLQQGELLWPIVVAAGILSMIPAYDLLRRYRRNRRRENDGFGYEFAFRLDRVVSASKIQDYLTYRPGAVRRRSDKIFIADRDAATKCPSLRNLQLDRRGGVRIEYASRDSTLVKVHAIARFRARRDGRWYQPSRWWLRTARFEVINEFLARTVSGKAQCVLRESRMFGDCPRVLAPQELLKLVTFVLDRSALTFVPDERRNPKRDAADVLDYARQLFGDGELPA